MLVLYGDFNNWFAAFAFWVFKYYGFKDVRIINGGRKKWLIEDRLITKEIPQYPKGNFIAVAETDDNIRTSHTWFVLILGYPNVKNYDGSWTEWGNMINNPVEK